MGVSARHLTLPRLKKGFARLRKALDKELSELDDDISDHVRESPTWAEKEDLLASVPGVDPTIARTLIAELPELGMLDRRQIAALACLAPWRPAVRPVARQELHRRSPIERAPRTVHGRYGGSTLQSDTQAAPRQARRCRKTQARGDHRRR
jgi:transposase